MTPSITTTKLWNDGTSSFGFSSYDKCPVQDTVAHEGSKEKLWICTEKETCLPTSVFKQNQVLKTSPFISLARAGTAGSQGPCSSVDGNLGATFVYAGGDFFHWQHSPKSFISHLCFYNFPSSAKNTAFWVRFNQSIALPTSTTPKAKGAVANKGSWKGPPGKLALLFIFPASLEDSPEYFGWGRGAAANALASFSVKHSYAKKIEKKKKKNQLWWGCRWQPPSRKGRKN